MRVMYLGIKNASSAVSNKEVELLAFSILIKHTFTDSIVRNASVRRCKELFGIGSTKMSRIIKNGLEKGYLTRRGNDIIANKVRLKGMNRRLAIKGGKTSIKDIETTIRETVLLNHIKKQSEFTDTFELKSRATTGFVPREEVARIKKAANKISRMSKNNVCSRGLSMHRVSMLCDASKPTARRVVDRLVKRGSIERKEVIVRTGIKPSFFDKKALSYLQEYGFGLFFSRAGEILCQHSNRYTYSSSQIVFK